MKPFVLGPRLDKSSTTPTKTIREELLVKANTPKFHSLNEFLDSPLSRRNGQGFFEEGSKNQAFEQIAELSLVFDPRFQGKCCSKRDCKLVLRHALCYSALKQAKPEVHRCEELKNLLPHLRAVRPREQMPEFEKSTNLAGVQKAERSKAGNKGGSSNSSKKDGKKPSLSQSSEDTGAIACDICLLQNFITVKHKVKTYGVRDKGFEGPLAGKHLADISRALGEHWNHVSAQHPQDAPFVQLKPLEVEINDETFIIWGTYDSNMECYELIFRGRLCLLRWDELQDNSRKVTPSSSRA